MVEAVHWCPNGNPLDARPGEVQRLLATPEGKTFGYGYGPGWSMVFYSARGDITVQPGQWVVRHDDGTVTVEDDAPTVPSAQRHDDTGSSRTPAVVTTGAEVGGVEEVREAAVKIATAYSYLRQELEAVVAAYERHGQMNSRTEQQQIVDATLAGVAVRLRSILNRAEHAAAM